jgi:AcrR family transcriptional regulator
MVSGSTRKRNKVTTTAHDPAPRAPLSRDRVLRAAIELADQEGFESLSMRKLAQALGVEAMSLYNHVANKGEILDGMIDIVFGEIDLPAEDDWKLAIRQRCISFRKALSLHPWALVLMESQHNPGPATLKHSDAVLGRLRGAGFDVVAAAHACSVLDSYVYGFALQERRLPFNSAKEMDVPAVELFEQMTALAHAYPHLAEMAQGYALTPGYTYSSEFEFGLDLILDGLDRIRDHA